MSSVDHDHVDRLTGTSTTGHEWDGIRELNTPLPKWWLYLFYVTIVWSVGYMVVYPAWPLISSYTTGVWGWTSRGAVQADLEDLKKQRSGMASKIAATSLADIEKDPQMLSFARAQGKAAFGDNCAPCHGAGGGGAVGFPNLNDDDWLWGGTAEAIQQTITYGVRSGHAKTREGAMPAFGKDGVLKRDEIDSVADYVLSLSKPAAASPSLEKGKKVFAENCAACHGDDGKGNLELGAPNLTDGIWLYGGDKATIVAGLVNGRGGVMPNFVGRLDDTTIKSLAVFVHTLGGGK